jgi:polar amino acid transport system substrate-binding protein
MGSTGRRRVAAVVAALLVVSACGAGATPSPSTPPASAPTASAAAPSGASSAPSSAPSAAAPSGASSTPSAAAAALPVVVPDTIKTDGKLTWCTSLDGAPLDFYAADGTTPQGSDYDMTQYFAQKWGVPSQIVPTAFDGIIAALNAKKCDLVISGMTITAARAQVIDFVAYLEDGEGILVPAGNPKNIHTLDDLSGHAIAVQAATSNLDALLAENKKLAAAGKPLMNIQTFPADLDAFQQLSLGRVDAYSTDAPVAAYYSTLPGNKGKFEIGGQISPLPLGIGVRKGDSGLKAAVEATVFNMYADGTLKSIIDKWGMTQAVTFCVPAGSKITCP